MCIDERTQLTFIISQKLSGCYPKSFKSPIFSEASKNVNVFGFPHRYSIDGKI